MFFRKVKAKEIIFYNLLNLKKEYLPKPAVQCIPKWYKEIEPRFPKEKKPSSLRTIKKCIPVFDAITAGYIFVTYHDTWVTKVDGEISFLPSDDSEIIIHPQKQAYNHPSAPTLLNSLGFPKFNNPFGIETPPGYSCIFKPPAHNPNPWFEILEGIVDTDTYTGPVHFPFKFKNEDFEGLIPAGTPLAQVIPFKRESWNSKFETLDEAGQLPNLQHIKSLFWDRYKRLFWSPKSFK
jgi:hypothetical protein